MSSTPAVPLEIQEIVIDMLAENDEDLSSAKACSLVCWAFLPRCRKHIYASIDLNHDTEPPSPTTHLLERLLSKYPEVANYIRKLDYRAIVEDFTNPPIQECLKRISRLQSLTIRRNRTKTLDWRSNPLRPVLLHFLHLPTLTRFRVFAIDNFVASDLIPCVNLKKLEISNCTTGTPVENMFSGTSSHHLIELNELVSHIGAATATMNICTAQRPDRQPIIDFRFLTKIAVVIRLPDDVEASQELFKRCGQLTDAHILFWDPEWICPSIANMLRPSMQTLRHIRVFLIVGDVHVDPLFDIPSEFEDMRNRNIIESISIKVLVQTDSMCRQGDDWGRLDEVLTKSGWVALKRVSLTIDIACYARTDKKLELAPNSFRISGIAMAKLILLSD